MWAEQHNKKRTPLSLKKKDAISEVEEANSNGSRLLFLDSLQEMKYANEGMQRDREYCS
jgi:hypothetical protein